MSHSLYDGSVMHHRVRPRRHRFTYKVFWSLLDIDQLDDLPRFFSHNRFNLFSFRDSDYGPRDSSPLRPWIETVCADEDINIVGGRVSILTFPRMLGYAFNPLSVWFCHDSSGDLAAVLYETTNTFGERHSYLLPVNDGRIDHTWKKRLFVSPFIDLDATYRFRVQAPGEKVTIASRVADKDGHLLTAALEGRQVDMTTSNLLRLFIRRPLMTVKVIAGIHYEALRLVLKRAPYRSRGAPPSDLVSMPMERMA